MVQSASRRTATPTILFSLIDCFPLGPLASFRRYRYLKVRIAKARADVAAEAASVAGGYAVGEYVLRDSSEQ